MSKKSFKYFHEGDEYAKVISFIEDNISLITNPMPEPMESGNECWVINKKIKITIEIYENEYWMYCSECDGKGYFEDKSDCCDAKRESDLGLCYECHDHCEPQECQACNGMGKVEILADENGLR